MSTPALTGLGHLIRRFRLTAGLTQEELADRSGLSVRAISDLERSLRTVPRMETLRMIAGALDLSSEQRASLLAAARPELASPVVATASVDAHSGLLEPAYKKHLRNLPIPPTVLIGREREVSQLMSLLEPAGARLITITGPGGVGKTRLAIAVAETFLSQIGEEVAFIDLTPVADPI